MVSVLLLAHVPRALDMVLGGWQCQAIYLWQVLRRFRAKKARFRAKEGTNRQFFARNRSRGTVYTAEGSAGDGSRCAVIRCGGIVGSRVDNPGRSSPARLHYLANRVDDCRLLREMDVVVGAWRRRATCPTAKKLPSLAAATAAILSAPPDSRGPERAVPNILKVFIVSQYVTRRRSHFTQHSIRSARKICPKTGARAIAPLLTSGC
jgi:hypothetical protein